MSLIDGITHPVSHQSTAEMEACTIFPSELFYNIASFVSLYDLVPLARTSTALHRLIVPLMYDSIILTVDPESQDPGLQAIRCLTTLCNIDNGLISLVKRLRLEGCNTWWP